MIESTKGPKALNEVAHVLKNYVGFSVIEVFDHAVAADGRPLPIDGMVIAYQGDGGSHIQIALEKVVGFSGIELGCVAHTSFDGQMNFLGL